VQLIERLIAVAAVLAWHPLSVRAEQLSGQIVDLVFNVESLVFRVEDLGGGVQRLQIRETATETRIELPADILFDFDKFDIRASAEPALKRAADLIRKGARGATMIAGHTDAKGSPAYNLKLSEQRSAAVQRWLVEREGLDGARFQVKGFGAMRPIAPNSKPDGSDDPEGRQRNRRVEIVFSRQ
jgi:outer membrane protein OmpA-like peptidoglycan-associated protein